MTRDKLERIIGKIALILEEEFEISDKESEIRKICERNLSERVTIKDEH